MPLGADLFVRGYDRAIPGYQNGISVVDPADALEGSFSPIDSILWLPDQLSPPVGGEKPRIRGG